MSNKDLIMELVNNLEVEAKNAESIAKILDCDIDGKIADVVEVIRCKDCKKHNDLKYPDCLWTDDDFFCAGGERKETNER